MTVSEQSIPLVVDLDGTLHHGDLSWMLFVGAVKNAPAMAVKYPLLWLIKGKAKAKLVSERQANLDIRRLDWDANVLQYVKEAKASGRRVVLATGSPQFTAEQCNHILGDLFDEVIGTTNTVNRIGKAKAKELINRYGVCGFDYIGNSAQDLDVWPVCHGILIANASSRVSAEAKRMGRPVLKEFS